jgi:tetratricopeptide (TPR) repeat protein
MLLLCLLLLACSPAVSHTQESADWYYGRAQEAIEAENYETAVRIIEEGKRLFPRNAELQLLLADLYYDKELYNLALEEYRGAARLQGEEYLTLVQISRCYGKLNQEQESIATLERILELYPESVSSIDDLGWMYFKTHQLEKGEELLLNALGQFGPDRGVYMTLGTLYSGMYDYENSKRYYLKAIQDALTGEDLYFASVAYYNLSLLEHSFYNYNSALRYTEESIQMLDRAPGHLARGELFQSRLDFNRAQAEYQTPMVKDNTP